MKKKMKKMNGERILDFEDVKERHEAERLANERCRRELAKLVIKHKSFDQLPLSLTMITQRRRAR